MTDYTALCARLMEAAEEIGDQDFADAAAAIRELEARVEGWIAPDIVDKLLDDAQPIMAEAYCGAEAARMAAEAKLAEVEKERDALQRVNDELQSELDMAEEEACAIENDMLKERKAAEATVATLTARVEAMRGALEDLIDHTHNCEKELTEKLHHADFCGESLPLTKARAKLAEVEKERDGLRFRVEAVESDRAYIIGANAGWDAAIEKGETSEAVKSAMVRFWKKLAEVQQSRAITAEATVATLTEKVEAMQDQRDNAISTLDAWFDRRKLGHDAIDKAVVDAASGYLRTSRVGGMPQEESDLILGVIQDMARLSLFADLFARAALTTENQNG